jgi:beta-D-xylosidase 4
MALSSISSAAVATLLFLAPVKVAAQNGSEPFVCDGSGDSAPYNATKEYLGCYQDSNVSILGEAKLSTIAMTPQYCANWCGGKGFGYGGILFGT